MSKKQGVKKVKGGSAYAAQRQQEFENWTQKTYWYAFQEAMDIATIVLHDTFGFGPDRQKKYNAEVEAIWNEVRNMQNSDTIDQDYFREKFEAAVKRAVGEENYVSREERYKYD